MRNVSSRSVRILAVANHLGSRGGLERTQLANCKGLAARGHTLDIVFQSAGDFFDEWRSFTRSMLKVSGTLPRRASPLASSFGVARAVLSGATRRPEVVYVYRYWDLPFATAVARLSGAKVVYHLCLPPPKRVPRYLRAALASVDWTVSVSQDTASRWSGTGLRTSTLSVVLTAVDLDRYRPADASQRSATRRALGLEDDEFFVLYAGRIDREKGVDVLVDAFGRAAAALGRCHLLVVGSASLGADPEDSRRFADELGALAEGLPVTFHPGRSDVVDLVQGADVSVVPSLWPEPLPRSVMEPLACGTPVIASRVGGIPEVLEGWLSEFLVEPGDVNGLAERLVSLRPWRDRDPGLALRLRAAAEARLSLDQEAQAVEEAMLFAISGARDSRRRRKRAASEAKS
jgi:glycosyltransferase involved in cell wall biosynthesis